MLRTRAADVSLWESTLPAEVLRLPEELARVDALLNDPVFFAPFVPFFDPRVGRPSTPMESCLRIMCLKFHYRLGYERVCREVSDSITWRRFCRIPLDAAVPHPTTLMKLTTRCGTAAVDGCNEALLAKATQVKLLRTTRLRADTTMVPADVAYPTDSGLLAKAVSRIALTARRIQAAGGATRTRLRDRSRSAGKRAHGIAAKLRLRRPRAATKRSAPCSGSPANSPGWPNTLPPTPNGCWSTRVGRCVWRRPKPSSSPPVASVTPPPGDAGAGCVARSMAWLNCWM